jgi:SAM-dependent methyltransferase
VRRPPDEVIDLGSFDRLSPISLAYGFDRGQPIDRLYIERFLDEQRDAITGRVLEVGDDHYTRRFGHRVRSSDVLHLNPGAPGATICADLVDAPHIATASFDCVILTQTLQYIFDLHAALRTLVRILAPGGVLLATVPGLSRTSDPLWSDRWMWNFTSRAVARLFAEHFGVGRIAVRGHGNVLAAIAFLHGLSVEDVGAGRLEPADAGYEVLVTCRALR